MNLQCVKTIWFTGLSGSGKSTISSMLESTLKLLGVPVFTLDGDALRTGLCKDLGFSQDDRVENIRRAGEVAKILNAAGITVLAAFITPAEDLRCTLRGMFQQNAYVEVFVDSPLVVCEIRDPEGPLSARPLR